MQQRLANSACQAWRCPGTSRGCHRDGIRGADLDAAARFACAWRSS